MRMTVGQLRRLIRETVNEVRMLSEGGLPEDWQEAQKMLQDLLKDAKQTASMARAIEDHDSQDIPALEKKLKAIAERVNAIDPSLIEDWKDAGILGDIRSSWIDHRNQESESSQSWIELSVVYNLNQLAKEIVTKFGDEYDLKGNMGESRQRSHRR